MVVLVPPATVRSISAVSGLQLDRPLLWRQACESKQWGSSSSHWQRGGLVPTGPARWQAPGAHTKGPVARLAVDGPMDGPGLDQGSRGLDGSPARKGWGSTLQRTAGGRQVAGRDGGDHRSGSVQASAQTKSKESVTTVFGTALLAATAYSVFSQTSGLAGPMYRGMAKKASPTALRTIKDNFPDAMWEESFIAAVAAKLFEFGFNRENSIAVVNTCRDEICRPLAATIDRQFGMSFNISGLGGLITCGTTGMGAGLSHSPQAPSDGAGTRERYVFFAFPHMSVSETGEVGTILRRGRGKPSGACGALIKVGSEARGGTAGDDFENDLEYSLLKHKILNKGPLHGNTPEDNPSLLAVTKRALEVINEDLESLVKKSVDPAKADYAVITGIQIHSTSLNPGEPFRMEKMVDYIAPSTMYAVIKGERYELLGDVKKIEEHFTTRDQDQAKK